MTPKRTLFLWSGAAALILLAAGSAVLFWLGPDQIPGDVFDAARAYADLKTQVAMGPRIPGSAGHAAFVRWAQDEFTRAGWTVDLQETVYQGQLVRNIIAARASGDGEGDWIILVAHYDTRPRADRDPVAPNRALPVPGANDGASGVAVLLELARALPESTGAEIWLVLVDAEDGGDLDGADWLLGSRAFVNELQYLAPGRVPDKVVVVDMVADADLNIHIESNSDAGLTAEIWETARGSGYGNVFLPVPKYSMLDDHTAFIQAGIPAVLLIDFDYPFWHTVGDTPEQTSAESLGVVGDVLLTWLIESAAP